MNEIQQLTSENNSLRNEVARLNRWNKTQERIIDNLKARLDAIGERKANYVCPTCAVRTPVVPNECPTCGAYLDDGYPQCDCNPKVMRYGIDYATLDDLNKLHSEVCRMPSCPTCNGMENE